MINHPEPIDIAMVKAIGDGAQTQIDRFTEVPEHEQSLDKFARAHRILVAIRRHNEYKKEMGGEKI